MALIDKIKAKAKANVKHIVLPEGEESRNVQAAVKIVEQGIATLTLLGDPAKVKEVAAGASLEGLEIIDPRTSDKCEQYAATLYELRKAKGMTPEQAAELVKDPMYYGVMMVKMGDADGLVSGAIHSTGDMLRPALQIIKSKPGIKTVSSCFLMECPNKAYGDDGVMVFADCAVNIDPDAEQLASIALGAADSARALAGIEPRVAMLSFSTKGSAKHDLVTKVQEATRIAKELDPSLMLDGELQLDAAIVESVGQLKAPGSPVAGKANVLVFRAWKRATSATSWCSAWRARRPTAPFCRASPSRATTSPAAAPWTTSSPPWPSPRRRRNTRLRRGGRGSKLPRRGHPLQFLLASLRGTSKNCKVGISSPASKLACDKIPAVPPHMRRFCRFFKSSKSVALRLENPLGFQPVAGTDFTGCPAFLGPLFAAFDNISVFGFKRT